MNTPKHSVFGLQCHLVSTSGDSLDVMQQFAERIGLRRRHTVMDWEAGREHPGGVAKRMLDVIANDAGFTERVAARLREKLKREEGEE